MLAFYSYLFGILVPSLETFVFYADTNVIISETNHVKVVNNINNTEKCYSASKKTFSLERAKLFNHSTMTKCFSREISTPLLNFWAVPVTTLIYGYLFVDASFLSQWTAGSLIFMCLCAHDEPTTLCSMSLPEHVFQ